MRAGKSAIGGSAARTRAFGRVVPGPGAALMAGILGLWWLAAANAWVNPFLLPSPVKVAHSGWAMLFDGSLIRHAVTSMFRVAAGFGLAVLIAVPLAFALGLVPLLQRLLGPSLEFLRHLPPLALIPLLILSLGIGEAQKVTVIILACFFPIFFNTAGGITQSDPKLIELGQVCGLSRRRIIAEILFPSALPSLLIGLRLGLGYGWRALVGAELIAAAAGLGYMIEDAQNLARTDIIYVGLVTIGSIGLVVDALCGLASRKLAPWIRTEVQIGRA
jgi:sulfonate transport system permease protein